MSGRSRVVLRFGTLVAYSALIFYLSAQSDLGDGASFLDFPGRDKVVHVIIYAIWGWIFSWALTGARPIRPASAVVIATILGTLYGVTDEIHQAYVPGRTSSIYDLAADAAGALLGALVHARWRKT